MKPFNLDWLNVPKADLWLHTWSRSFYGDNMAAFQCIVVKLWSQTALLPAAVLLSDEWRRCNVQLQRPALFSSWIVCNFCFVLFFNEFVFVVLSESCILYLKQSMLFSGVKKKLKKKRIKGWKTYGKSDARHRYIYIHTYFISYTVYIYKVTCVCLDTSLFGNLHCWNSYTTTTEHAPSLSMMSSALGSVVSAQPGSEGLLDPGLMNKSTSFVFSVRTASKWPRQRTDTCITAAYFTSSQQRDSNTRFALVFLVNDVRWGRHMTLPALIMIHIPTQPDPGTVSLGTV